MSVAVAIEDPSFAGKWMNRKTNRGVKTYKSGDSSEAERCGCKCSPTLRPTLRIALLRENNNSTKAGGQVGGGYFANEFGGVIAAKFEKSTY